MKNKKQKRGFSLPEVIVAVTMISLVIVTATNLLIASMRANTNNINRMVAYNLAQEGLEGFRNIRDNYCLHNLNWLGESGNKNFGAVIESDGYYTVNKTKLRNKDECKDEDNMFELSGNFDSVITSNTHPQQDESVEVVDLTPLFAEAIYRAQRGLSISKLFE